MQLTLSGAFSIVWSLKVYSLEQRCSCGWFPVDNHFWQFAWTDGNVAGERQHNTVNISVNTSCIESCTKTNFSEVVQPLNFSKNNVPLLKARPNSIFSLPTLFFHFKQKSFFPQLNERELEPTFDAAGQWRSHLRFSALLLDRCQTTMDSCFEKRGLQKNPHREGRDLSSGWCYSALEQLGWNYYMINWNPFSPLQKSTKCSLSTPVGGLESLDSQRLSLTVDVIHVQPGNISRNREN